MGKGFSATNIVNWPKKFAETLGDVGNKNHLTVTDNDDKVSISISSSSALGRLVDRIKAKFSSTEQEKNKQTITNFYQKLANKIGMKEKKVREVTKGILGNRGEKGRPLSGRRAACITNIAARYRSYLFARGDDVVMKALRPFSEAAMQKTYGKGFKVDKDTLEYLPLPEKTEKRTYLNGGNTWRWLEPIEVNPKLSDDAVLKTFFSAIPISEPGFDFLKAHGGPEGVGQEFMHRLSTLLKQRLEKVVQKHDEQPLAGEKLDFVNEERLKKVMAQTLRLHTPATAEQVFKNTAALMLSDFQKEFYPEYGPEQEVDAKLELYNI